MSVDSNRDLSIRYVGEVIGGGNLALIDELVHADGQDLSWPWPHRREGFRRHIASFRSAFDPQVATERVIADEACSAVYCLGKGRHVGPAFRIEPSGVAVEDDFISTLRYRDGLIVTDEVMVDMLRLLVYLATLGSRANKLPR